jgi:putative ABC transport system permease protein
MPSVLGQLFASNPPLMIIGGLFVLIFGSLGVIALRRRLLLRIAVREVTRRPGQSILVVAGLMVASSSIIGALAVGDLFDEWLTSNVLRNWGRVDVLVTAGGGFFPGTVADQLHQDPQLRSHVAGVQPGVELTGAVGDLDQRLARSAVRLVAFEPPSQPAFGAFVLNDGRDTFGDGLGSTQVLLSQKLADDLHARAGDRLNISVSTDGTDHMAQLSVGGIAAAQGPGTYGLVPTVFMTLDGMQTVTGNNLVNVVRISATGDGQRELDESRAIVPLVGAALGAGRAYNVRAVKAADLDASATQGVVDRYIWLGLSLLAVITGLLLAINLAIALAAERRSRLGVLRAMGLTRQGLIQTAALEGAIYCLAGAIASVGPGILVALLIGSQFARFSLLGPGTIQLPAGADLLFQLPVKLSTMSLGIALGALLMLLTVVAAAVHTSRMTIVPAIRNLPELPVKLRWGWRSLTGYGALGLIGAAGVLSGNAELRLFGGIALILVAVRATASLLERELRITFLGFALVAWSLFWTKTSNETSLYAPLTSVLGVSLVVIANLRALDRALGLLSARTSVAVAILRPPLAYLTRRPVRSGLTVFGFSLLVTYILTEATVLTGSAVYLSSAPAYDVQVASAGTRHITLPAAIIPMVSHELAIPSLTYDGPLSSVFGNNEAMISFYAVTPDFIAHPPVPIRQRLGPYPTDASVWQAVARDPNLIVTSANYGPYIELVGPSGLMKFHAIALTAPVLAPASLLNGVIASPAALQRLAGQSSGTTHLLRLRPGTDPVRVAQAIQQSLFTVGVEAIPTRQLFAVPVQAVNAVRLVLQLFLSLGLITAVLTLGILSLRAVIERRYAIGLLRALGYRGWQVVAGQYIENGLTVSIGVIIGFLMGAFWGVGSLEALVSSKLGFVVNWMSLMFLLLLIYGTLIVVTAIPAWLASRLPPAQALRFTE